MSYLWVFLGGGLGSVARYSISVITEKFYGGVLPLSTLASNLISSLILVLGVEILRKSGADNSVLRAAILIGFCGGFSTFSTFSFETVQLIKNGNHLVAVGNIIISVGVCLILIYKLTK